MTRTARGWKSLAATTCFLPVAILTFAIASAGIALAQTCTPLCYNATNTGLGDYALVSNYLNGSTGDDNTASGAYALFSDTTGYNNTASGAYALYTNITGSDNTANGNDALYSNTAGNDNTASGDDSLLSNTTGDYNTASGVEALQFNTTGNSNTASGAYALDGNTAGYDNTASGVYALLVNTTGGSNTASGFGALESNTTGGNNTASGSGALVNNNGSNNTANGANALAGNTAGYNNTASGADALAGNTGSYGNAGYDNTASGAYALYTNTGEYNTADGDDALYSNTTGEANTACGVSALYFNTTGNFNTAIGISAGSSITTGSNNIVIANRGTAGQSNTIEIGVQGTQTSTFIAGISGSAITGADVVVNSSGRLGVVASSARYKRDIRDMDDASSNLMKLRPVTFRYKNDETATMQYGLVAEEVARVYPELVTYGADGKIETVRYSMLSAMLLNELKKEAGQDRRLAEQIRDQAVRIATQQHQIDNLRKQGPQIEALTERLEALERQARTATPQNLAAASR
jgi:trimeric autotransporter adhesin